MKHIAIGIIGGGAMLFFMWLMLVFFYAVTGHYLNFGV